ncbi:MAG TPA: ribosome silencing factor [Steroidobacteraceae bacterium]|nr:ribosome silencing factor [Steroidobacteraceae bacterium]
MPVNRKTPQAKSTDRNEAVANPPGKKAGSERKAAGKPKTPDKPKVAGQLKTAKPAQHRKADQALPSLKAVVIDALADMKALEVKVLDVRGLTDIADFMVIASGTSDRHVRSVAQRVVEKTKEAGFRPHGVEGQQDSDWVLIDLNEMIVHVMLPRVREFYGLEKLWDMTATKRAARA